MAYFLKQTNYTKGLYLQIYFSFRDPETKKPKNKCIETLGYVKHLQADGIEDPVAFYKDVVKKMNDQFHEESKKKKVREVGDSSPVKRMGYFPCDAILRKLDIVDDVNKFHYGRKIKFSIYECFRALVMARLVEPCSKRKTAAQIIPTLFTGTDFSYDQILDCLEILGNEYERFIEILTNHTNETYIIDVKKTFFDCTNFYFEIDKEDEWRKKGPSKEKRTDPILGMGLLLDAACIPIGMRLYPGNQSEIPVMREILSDLKDQNGVDGRTVRVADKGLNCARNIHDALNCGDGYLFSKSIKKLSDSEQNWALLEHGFTDIFDDQGNLKYKIKSCIDSFVYSYTDENGRKHSFKVREKRVVTYNPKLARKQIREIEKLAAKAACCRLCEAKKSEYGESSKYVIFSSADENGEDTGKKAHVSIDEKKIEKDKRCAGYNMLITSEYNQSEIEIYNTYHELWRIEESFRNLKSELDARPVYLQSINRIKGHFLVCYTAVLLERLFQFKALREQFESQQIYEFIRGFQVSPGMDGNYTNLSISGPLLTYMKDKYNLPVTNFYLTEAQIKKILDRPI